MAATVATMAMLNAKCLAHTNSPKILNPSKPAPAKPISLLSIQKLPKGTTLASSKLSDHSITLAGTALAGAIFATLSSCEPALATQQIAEIAAEGSSDSRGLALLLPIIPAIAWVLFNILQPALNQINQMRSVKGLVIGLGGMAASGLVLTPHVSASEVAVIADAVSDNRGQLLLFVIAPAILWVLYNILQPALNQLNKMRSQ
ncbi:Photosystem II protein like [Actinidia chinensis var. chinensis]|uniref:Photosystem II protein like n=1 Tax=Actinidia chinensis var. chinensis TaxID=1590841 RepID=A0A2R6P3G5_ACTCC|nr:Photosystem II protein like [Actinidia chinensis var. chinensis]